MLSPFPSLPRLQQLKQHVVWSLKQKNTLPEEFAFVGSVSSRPYAFEDEETVSSSEQQQHETGDLAAAAPPAAPAAAAAAAAAGLASLGASLKGVLNKFVSFLNVWRSYLDVSSGNVASLTAEIPEHYR